MPITNGYCTLTEFKEAFGIESTDADLVISDIITDVSRAIDNYCRRQFYATASSVRYFRAASRRMVLIDDCTAITALATDDGNYNYPYTWATTDYFAMPTGSTPYTWLEAKNLGAYSFPLLTNGVKVTATWGYCATGAQPAPIRRACLLQANRIYERRKAAFGVTSVSDIAPMTVIPIDNDVTRFLTPYVKEWIG